ncbi:MAG: cation:proton antiporter [Alphaproteobacteria bacterium]
MKESVLTDVFGHACLFLALSALVIPGLRYFKIPVSLGYLLAGVMLGPFALGSLFSDVPILNTLSLDDGMHVKILAELGIVLLLFVIGLEVTPRRLWQMRSLVFGLGGAQVLITAFIIGVIAILWGNNVQVSILLGFSLALSSTAIVIQWLHEQKLFVSHVGRSSFSILLFQDLAVIPILLLLTVLSANLEGNILNFVSFSLLKMFLTVIVMYFAGKVILKPVFLFTNKHGGSEVFMALSLLIIVASSLLASLAGLSMALGAFIAGLLLADTEYRHEISSLIIPFKSMLLGIFFLSFGMGINLHFIAEKPLWIMASVVGLMTIKASIIFVLCKLYKQSTAVSAESAILLSQAGEFGLLVVGSALTVGLMAEGVGQFMLITIGMTMMVTPLIAPLARRVGKEIENKSYATNYYNSSKADVANNHIVILGFGRVGRAMAESLCKEGFQIIGFDNNIERVNQARLKSMPVYLGDASKLYTIKAANLNDALCVVVTLDEAQHTKKIIQTIRNINAGIPIIVRVHNIDSLKDIEAFENVEAIAEDVLISAKLSEKVIDCCMEMDIINPNLGRDTS